MKRDKHDDIFSKLVRERNDWTCECCGKEFHNNTKGLHCSHFQGRRSVSTRYHPLNALAHCVACHRKLGERPAEFVTHYDEVFPNMRDAIVQLSNQTLKMKPWMREEIYLHHKSEYNRLRDMRADGCTGYIGFTSPAWYFSGDLSLLNIT